MHICIVGCFVEIVVYFLPTRKESAPVSFIGFPENLWGG